MSGDYSQHDLLSASDNTSASAAETAAHLSRGIWDDMRKETTRRGRSSDQQQGDRTRSRHDKVVTPLAHPNFQGAEVISLDVEPEQHEVQPGQTLHEIARQHLGQGASAQDIRNHVREIERANGLTPGSRITPHAVLILPGHTRDGGYVTTRSAGWQDDIAPERYTVQSGETIESIARQHLGSGASEEAVARHAQEILDVNFNGHQPQRIEGRQILLPGRTADGQLVTDPDHVPAIRRTVWSNGVERIEQQNSDGALAGVGFVRRPDGDGAYFEHHWGPRPEDNYDLTRTAQGRYLIASPPGSAAIDRTEANDFRVNRARWDERQQRGEVGRERGELYEAIQRAHDATYMDDETQARLQRDMSQFELRARREGLSPQEVARTYEQVGRLLQHPDATGARLAGEILDQAAHPTDINQGQHGTCGVASLESRIYTRHPSEVARMVADVHLNGRYVTRDGSTIQVPHTALIQTEEIAHSHGNSNRSYASEIVQVTAMNIEYQRHGVRTDNGAFELIPGQFARYQQGFQRMGANPPDVGDRIIDLRTNQPMTDSNGIPLNNIGVTDNQIIDISRQIIGQEEGDTVLANAQRASYGYGYDRAERIDSEQDLRQTLTRLRQGGHLPAQMIIHSGNEPFFGDSGGGVAGGSGGWHVVTVRDFDERTGRVSLDNQWGTDADHTKGNEMSVSDLYLATLAPGSPEIVRELRRRQQQNPDYLTQIDLLRQQNMASGTGHISSEQYAQRCADLLWRVRDDWYNDRLSWNQYAQVHIRMVGVLNDLPESEQRRLLNPLPPD
ncbi:MAG TPA: LysM domain-containing protein, partial [Candidatus Obscuribacterales bacterium]